MAKQNVGKSLQNMGNSNISQIITEQSTNIEQNSWDVHIIYMYMGRFSEHEGWTFYKIAQIHIYDAFHIPLLNQVTSALVDSTCETHHILGYESDVMT